MSDEPIADQPGPDRIDEELSGDPELDKRLSEPILKGHAGLDAAQVWIGAFLIVAAGFLAFSNFATLPFTRAEHELIATNSNLHAPATLAQGIEDAQVSPLAGITLAVNWWLTPGNSAVFHGVNVLLHLLNGVLVFFVARRLLRLQHSVAVAMLAGLLFVLHPLTTDAVNALTARPMLLATAFLLMATLSYLKTMGIDSTREPGEAAQGFPFGTIAFGLAAYVLAWASHPAALMLPALLAVIEWTFPRSTKRGNGLDRQIPFWMMFAALATATAAYDLLRFSFAFDSSLHQAGRMAYLIQKTLLPLRLSVYPALAGILPSLALLLVLPAIALRSFSGVVLAWYAIALFATGITSGPQEANAYLALAGGVWLIPWLFSRLRGTGVRAAVGIAAALVLLACGALTNTRNHTWSNPILLWQQASALAPEEAAPLQALGILHLDQAERLAGEGEEQTELARHVEQAQRYLNDALTKGATGAELHAALGRARMLSGAPREALDAFRNALRYTPNDATLALQTAHAAVVTGGTSGAPGDLAVAAQYYEHARVLGPIPSEALVEYAALLARTGAFEQAAALLSQVAEGKKDSPYAAQYESTAGMASAIQRVEEKAAQLLSSNPRDPEGLILASQAASLRQRPLEALYQASAAYELAPGNWQAWVALGAAKARMGEIEGFLETASPAPQAPATSGDAWMLLAQKCAAQNDIGAAEAVLTKSKAVTGSPGSIPLALGAIALDLGNAAQARALFEQAAKEMPRDPAPWLNLANVALAAGQKADAARCLSEAEKRGADPGEVDALRKNAGLAKGRDAVPVMR